MSESDRHELERLDRQTVADCAGYLQRLANEGRIILACADGPKLSLGHPHCWHDGRGRLIISVESKPREE